MFAVVLLCIGCIAYWWWRRPSAKTAEPPSLPGAWPIVGHIPLLLGGSVEIWDQINNLVDQSYEVGGVLRMNFGPVKYYCVTDPEDCHTIAITCLEKDSAYDYIEPWFGEGLLTAKYETWKNHDKLLKPTFSQTVLNTFMGVFNSQSRKLVKELEENAGKGLFDPLTYLRHNALDIVCLTALGVDFTDSNLASDYFDAAESLLIFIVERFIKIWWHSPYTFAWSKLKKRQDACLKILHKMSNTILQKRKSQSLGNTCVERSIITGTKFKPFIDVLLEQSVEKGAFNDEQIRAHVDTMLAAGHETTPNALLFTMVLLGSYPDVQEKVFSEIQEVLGGDRDTEKMDLSRLKYLEAVLKESMRLFPVAPIIARKLKTDVKLKNYTLSGRHCLLFLCGLHKHPMWGPDRHEFKPDRWLEPGKVPDNLYVYAPFGLGRRQCIGKIFAMMSMKTTLAHVLRSYRIKADHTKMRLSYAVTLKPGNDGHYISIEKRT